MDSILILAFGGPTAPHEVRPFVEGILGNHPSRAGRVTEVVAHYERIGGGSPLLDHTCAQARALGAAVGAPAYVGMQHWRPTVSEAVAQMAADGRRDAVVVVMAPHRSQASWDRYLAAVEEARIACGPAAPKVRYVRPWHSHPGYVEAIADRVRAVAADMSRTAVIFTAHAIPRVAKDSTQYVEAVRETARLVASAIGANDHSIAFQCAADPATWTGPDVLETIRNLDRSSVRTAIVSPIGFLCDHVEVLYDLDVAARAVAEETGIRFVRAETVGTHPSFISALADLVAKA